MSSSGYGEAFDLETKESAWKRFWRYAVYAWTIGRNALTVWLVYLAFGKMESIFQKLMLAGLVLILQSVSDSRTSILRSMIEEAYLHRKLFLGVHKRIDRNSVDSDERALDKLIKDYHKSDGFYFINIIANFVVYIYVIWKVFDVLVLS
jgi:hypothetical protein